MVGGAEALMCSVVPCMVSLGQEAFGAGAGAFVGVECSWLVGFVVSLGAEGVVGPVGLGSMSKQSLRKGMHTAADMAREIPQGQRM